jgi:hypothetical protein
MRFNRCRRRRCSLRNGLAGPKERTKQWRKDYHSQSPGPAALLRPAARPYNHSISLPAPFLPESAEPKRRYSFADASASSGPISRRRGVSLAPSLAFRPHWPRKSTSLALRRTLESCFPATKKALWPSLVLTSPHRCCGPSSGCTTITPRGMAVTYALWVADTVTRRNFGRAPSRRASQGGSRGREAAQVARPRLRGATTISRPAQNSGFTRTPKDTSLRGA